MNDLTVFRTKKIMGTRAKTIGSGGDHLFMEVFDPRNESRKLQTIGFGFGKYLSLVESKKPFDLCFVLEENNFNGKVFIRLNIKDIRESNEL